MDGYTKISEIHQYMRDIDIKGKIVDMNAFMLLVNDKTGQTFIRYSQKFRSANERRMLLENLKIGNNVKITNCEVVNYHGILQLRLTRKGQITKIT
ncbi:MAG: hypothetical protein ABIH76_00180 [Candidatus Bathyarchaeota archaeon]